MIRRIIEIDEEACTGCGLCAEACHEGAIALVDGKAKLMREDFCDGFGDCLPACPAGAIHFVEREAPAYDEAAVVAAKFRSLTAAGHASAEAQASVAQSGCPGTRMQQFARGDAAVAAVAAGADDAPCPAPSVEEWPSELAQWPCQIKLVPVRAPFFAGADLLVAADCTAFAYAAFHRDFMRGKTTVIGCPKLDAVDYADKLSQIIAANDIRSLTVLRMQVPCCGGLERAARAALDASGKRIPFEVTIITTDGHVFE